MDLQVKLLDHPSLTVKATRLHTVRRGLRPPPPGTSLGVRLSACHGPVCHSVAVTARHQPGHSESLPAEMSGRRAAGALCNWNLRLTHCRDSPARA